MRSVALVWCLTVLYAEEAFVSHFEYGEMLYKAPRGVACALCHGKDGSGGVIAGYRHKGEEKTLQAPDIRQLSFERFYKPFTSEGYKRTDIMPRYHLTKKEIRAIYDYLQALHKQSNVKEEEDE